MNIVHVQFLFWQLMLKYNQMVDFIPSFLLQRYAYKLEPSLSLSLSLYIYIYIYKTVILFTSSSNKVLYTVKEVEIYYNLVYENESYTNKVTTVKGRRSLLI